MDVSSYSLWFYCFRDYKFGYDHNVIICLMRKTHIYLTRT